MPLLSAIVRICQQYMPTSLPVVGGIKAVRKWGYLKKGVAENNAEIIVCKNNFHGRTLSIVSFSTDATARADFGPFTPGFVVVPFGDADAMEQVVSENTVAV